MDGWQELTSNIVTAGLWPAAVVILGLTFRKGLRGALQRITKFEGFGASIELRENVKQLDAAADRVQIDAAQRELPEVEGDKIFVGREPPLRHLVDVAHISPSAAIVDSWREVEESLLQYLRTVRNVRDLPDENYTTPLRVLQVLQRAEMISLSQSDLLHSLRKTRNSVAHSQSKPSEGQALAYVDAAALAIQTLTTDRWAIERGEH